MDEQPKRKYRKLSAQEVLDLRERFWNRGRTGETLKEIAAAYGISARRIRERIEAAGGTE
jgi:DNA-directed RNA polymerase sigma subunit (sigma70/sigma32)